MTALHEGWLTGCRAIADDVLPSGENRLSRCFLLTDGLANVGLTDPEQIAGEAAGIRDNASIGTSTFGIGTDYDESLLAPMAVAGGGQFHHLRSPAEIASTFIGELGELLSVAVSQVRLELEVDPAVSVEVISEYWPSQITVRPSRWSVLLGELLADEERHLVARFGFPRDDGTRAAYGVRSRLLWVRDGREFGTDWQEVLFSYADDQACSAEIKNPDVMHWVGLHQAEWAKREAVKRSRSGDVVGAPVLLRQTLDKISAYAEGDSALLAVMDELTDLEKKVARKPLSSGEAKEAYYQTQLRSRGQKDLRDE